MKRIAISQSNYIPWKGYFDFINSVDEFVLYDDAQFTRRDWRNRNLIKTAAGPKWLTIPVQVKGRFTQKVNETAIAGADWPNRHWRSIALNYARAAHFHDYGAEIEKLYAARPETLLSEVNFRFITGICRLLGIRTRFRWSSDFELQGDRSERLVNICRQAGADVYVSGPAARDYLDDAKFARSGIRVVWMDYERYPAYRQLYGDFQHGVSIVDLLLNEGPRAQTFMKSFGAHAPPPP
jgi:hypothetical protein